MIKHTCNMDNLTVDSLFKEAEKINDPVLKEKTIEFLKNPLPTHSEIELSNVSLEESPASVKRHHKYPKGLLEHTMAVTKLSYNIAVALEEVYGLELDKDLIVAGALLHDIMKPQNYQIKEEIKEYKVKINNNDKNCKDFKDNENSDEKTEKTEKTEYITETKVIRRFDHSSDFHLEHLTLATSELYKRDFPLKLIKVVSSHHGDYGSSRPDSIEAWIIHHADNMDANLNDIAIRIGNSRARDLNVDDNKLYEKITPLKIYELRSHIGKENLIEYLKNMMNSNEENKR
ncbi:HDIG domain-containing metalloprotein [Methanococcus voltae]|uniref:Metal dependent phosphohydrolase n=1 Tax=Methanococcus voltae (strain ATCC BAA-1334 / A3) TaxID=456320 RepID=D7DUR9_METV3|nr:HDIG domain-containing metalloprotein [Methanococcus voltae]MCS3900681.1 7,8-dihydroneopterin 2',3'-cyclic phosphate phosphodiesterase [Methanococcus voltae]